MAEFRAEVRLPVPAAEAYEWHRRPGAFERLSPPWVDVQVAERHGTIAPGSLVDLRLGRGPLSLRWVLEHEAVSDGLGFADVQRRGPFRSWRHEHRFRDAAAGCVLEDRVAFELPTAARWAEGRLRAELGRLFRYRHRQVFDDLDALQRTRPARALTVLVTGTGGLLGRQVVAALGTAGHRVVRLVRRLRESEDELRWDSSYGLDPGGTAPRADALIHLAGESIAGGPWTEARKRRIRESRTVATRALVESVMALDPPPSTVICASAVGWYGDRGDDVLDEGAPAGRGFLPDVCREWEGALDGARKAGARAVHLRFGLVLSPSGGLLGRVLPPFSAGLGGPLGSGRQWMSWVSLDDAVFACLHALSRGELEGPVNVTAPEPVTNREFTRTLGAVLRRPAVIPVPASLLRSVSREMADELLFGSQRVVPRRLLSSGFAFRDTAIEPALRRLLGR
jgi:hypothetical protein